MQPDWEIWIDTNISPIIAKWMAEQTGLVVKSSYSLSLHYLSDKEIYEKAKEQGNVILISKDADFPELISRLGAPPKLINIRIGNMGSRQLWERIQAGVVEGINILMNFDIAIVEID
jgi:predicted nuclease of predicted toxin-antitoxin system